jgi:hypothetical protein
MEIVQLKLVDLRLVLFQEFKELLDQREAEFHVEEVEKEFLEQDKSEGFSALEGVEGSLIDEFLE